MSRALFVLLSCALGAAAAAQEPHAGTPATNTVRLTAEEAVSRALAVSPRLARLSALETAAAAGRRGARAERLPQLDLIGGHTHRSDVPELTISQPTGDPAQPLRQVTVFPNIPDNTRFRAAITIPLFTGGRISGAITAAESALAAAARDLDAGRADLVLETKTAYWSLVTSREGARVLREALRAFDAHLRDARNRERLGMAARNEVLAVQVERDRVELDRLRANTAAEIAAANLRRLLDLAPGTRIETTDSLATAVETVPDIEPLVAQAATTRAERKALAARVASAQALVRMERSSRLPQVAVAGGYTYANPNRDIVPPTAEWRDTWDIGVGISWSLLDFGRRSASQARARSQADALREQLRELDRAIRLEVTQRALELRTAAARVSVAERSVESARENRRVAGDRYREGLVPSSELLDAEVAHERASLALTEALASLRLAVAGLDRAVGR